MRGSGGVQLAPSEPSELALNTSPRRVLGRHIVLIRIGDRLLVRQPLRIRLAHRLRVGKRWWRGHRRGRGIGIGDNGHTVSSLVALAGGRCDALSGRPDQNMMD